MIIGAPDFDVNNLPVAVDSYYYPEAVIAEQARVCGGIDKRLDELEKEFCRLVSLKEKRSAELAKAGFWRKFAIYFDISALSGQINLNRDLRRTLYDARWRRTLG